MAFDVSVNKFLEATRQWQPGYQWHSNCKGKRPTVYLFLSSVSPPRPAIDIDESQSEFEGVNMYVCRKKKQEASCVHPKGKIYLLGR